MHLVCNWLAGLEQEQGITGRLKQRGKAGHLARMAGERLFRFVRECLLHHQDEGGAERIVGILLSQGCVESLVKLGKNCRLTEAAHRALGSSLAP